MKTAPALLGGLLTLAACQNSSPEPSKITTATIAGSYDFVLTKHESRPYAGSTTVSKGLLTIARLDDSNITIATPEFPSTTTYAYSADPQSPSLFTFKYGYNLSYGTATFYPASDSLHLDYYQHVSASSSTTYTYCGYRRP